MEIRNENLESIVNELVLKASTYEAEGKLRSEFDAISEGLRLDPHNYELYYMWGLLEKVSNSARAWLCVEQSLELARRLSEKDGAKAVLEDVLAIRGELDSLSFSVRKVSFIIVSYNDCELLQYCIRSILDTMPRDSYEIVIVDNCSSDKELHRYLDELEGLEFITIIRNDQNLGFPAGCNIGYLAANTENDIMLLNNDAILMPGSMFYLRMALYSDRSVGAVSALSNSASAQEIPLAEGFEANWWKHMDVANALSIASSISQDINVPKLYPYEKRCRLTGFAMLIKNEAAKDVLLSDKIMDEIFSPGYFEDDDLGMRINAAGYRQLLVHNSFIYHNGGSGFGSEDKLAALDKKRRIFEEKWGFDIWSFTLPEHELVDKIMKQVANFGYDKQVLMPSDQASDGAHILMHGCENAVVKILDLECGMGATMALLQYLLPNAQIIGYEKNPLAAAVGRRAGMDIRCIGNDDIEIQADEFDFVIDGRGLRYIKK